ncbi:beta-eliminating lyase-related protein [Streptomyces sp. NBS 14/10]|uniref:threonine aldolase family protein n=1 Tax=Streptomyces sp. NBS 14/10 TaxID=1945643 RepID=UPI000B7E5CD1|nr:beta-eliminating lyase-related protein [Streptomyces sp. NBS 14/10]KAK1180234.1 beta-eliminating lyase-related protein [Streptomyces sp. NBS 14/10]NUS84572.1 threonine aldolase [Streptomyces sp.]
MADGTAQPEQPEGPEDIRARRLAAWRGSTRKLTSLAVGERIGERLARLTADAAGSYDLDDWLDFYGNGDGVVGELERRVAELLGMEAAAFFPTGTMAQQIALRCWAGRTGNAAVAVHPLSHLEVHERDACLTVSGLRAVHPTSEPRLPTADEVRELDEPFGTLALELPLRDTGFALPTWDELTAVVEAAREREAVVHFDGARLWECTAHFGRELSEIAALADSVYVSFYKSLDGISGAALAGPEALVAEAKAWRHRYGGQVFQQWPAALAALAGLDRELPRLPSYVAHAQVVARALDEAFTAAGVPWFRVHPHQPHIHRFQVWLPYPAADLDEAGLRLAEETRTTLFGRWWESGPPGLAMTEVTVASSALEWTADDVAAAVAAFLKRLPEGDRAVG